MAVDQKASFHEGYEQVTRIGELKNDINKVRKNPLAFNTETNCYNYEVYFSDLCSLFYEGNAKFNETEQKQVLYLKKLVEDTFLFFPPHKTVIKESTRKRVTVVKTENWRKVREMLEVFERYILQKLDAHGLGNPDVEGEGLF